MIDFIVWVFTNIAMAPYNLTIALMNPGSWLDWSNNESLVRFIYYGASVEFFFVVFTTFLIVTVIGPTTTAASSPSTLASSLIPHRAPSPFSHRRLKGTASESG